MRQKDKQGRATKIRDYQDLLIWEKELEAEDRKHPYRKNRSWWRRIKETFLQRKSAKKNLWFKNWNSAREALAPPVSIPQLRFKNTGAGFVWSNLSLRQVLAITTIATVALCVIFTSALYIDFSKGSSSPDMPLVKRNDTPGQTFSDWKNTVHSNPMSAPVRLTDHDSEIQVFRGSFQLSSGAGTEKHRKEWRLEASDLQGNFDFRKPIDFTISHRLINVSIKGTRFNADLSPSQGSMLLCEGVLKIRYQSKIRPDFIRDFVLVAPAQLVFDEHKVSQKITQCGGKDAGSAK